ncbi:hypothetical protein [Bryobacter aggregatus]|uniref:hypothetical protein n=1 Tax=Bryobacter aggregatus TaxID=360054 RepID=UPI0004E1D58A|nr:hypothetical protein [Bryobacter aggregatus]
MKKWLIGTALVLALGVGGAYYYAKKLQREWEPMARQQLIEYLEKRFDSSVEVGKLDFKIPISSPWELLRHGADTQVISAYGEDFKLRYKRRTDIEPMIVFKRLTASANLEILYQGPRTVKLVKLEGLRITMPPKGERPVAKGDPTPQQPDPNPVLVEKIVADGTFLQILPSKPNKPPLEFDLYRLTLSAAGPGKGYVYETVMTNPKPPGQIQAKGHFGPWNREDPRESALDGDYVFANADLGVFKGIAGMLQSTGHFEGVLEEIRAQGECRVQNFSLSMSGNPVPLNVKYSALVDGTNGDTYLQPVQAVLGKTAFTARGHVIGLTGISGREIHLDVDMPKGHLGDVLRLAVKGQKQFLHGFIQLKTTIDIPPGPEVVINKIKMKGHFEIKEANFTSNAIQDKIDGLSKRGQGKPGDDSIDHIPATFRGQYRMADGKIHFEPVIFVVPGALVDLKGSYEVDPGELDFHGSLNLAAKMSDTFGGWKRWALKPFNPIFAKNDVGTFLRIAVTGSKDNPKFGLDKKP